MPSDAAIRVTRKSGDVYEVEVVARQATSHMVTVPADAVARLGGAHATAERLLEESFRFLLEREPNTSILRSFQITDISRYFPEYAGEIQRRLSR